MFKARSYTIVYLTITVFCLAFCTEAKLLFASNSSIQQQEVRTVTADKSKPRQEPKKEKRDVASRNTVAPNAPSPAMLCAAWLLLLLDDVKQVRIVAFNGPANATVNFTTTQTNEGIIGVSHSETGPFIPSIVLPVQLDGSGNGSSEIFYVQGLQLGTTVLFATSSEMGPTTSADYEVIPQCNCPPIPIVP